MNIKKCPWCGKKPRIAHNGNIFCSNLKCAMNNTLIPIPKNAWNSRLDPWHSPEEDPGKDQVLEWHGEDIYIVESGDRRRMSWLAYTKYVNIQAWAYISDLFEIPERFKK